MEYLVKSFRLTLRCAHIKNRVNLVRRWLHIKELDIAFKTKKEALHEIAFQLSSDKKGGISGKYKYTLECIK